MSEISILNGYKIKDKKAVRYYDTISNMKSDTTLKAGMYVKTKGYYSVNDGGNAEYYITSIESETEYQEELNNGLYATLIINENTANILQFGIKSDNTSDISTIVNNLLNKNYKVYIPKGNYLCTDSLTINDYNILYGDGLETRINFTGNSFLDFTNGVIKAEISNFFVIGSLQNENSIGIDMHTTDSKQIADCILKSINFNNFSKGISTQYAWCNSFYDIRFNSTNKVIEFDSQSNNNNFYSCHFLRGDSLEGISTFTNNDIISFFGCEFANGFTATTYNVKLAFYSCYFEGLPDHTFLTVGTVNSNDQENQITFYNCHHTGNTKNNNNRYLCIPISSLGKNVVIKSDTLELYTPTYNGNAVQSVIENPLTKGLPIAYISAHNNYNIASANNMKKLYDSESNKFLIQSSINDLIVFNSISMTTGDKIRMDLSIKLPSGLESRVTLSDGTNTKLLKVSGTGKLTKYHIEFEADHNYNQMYFSNMGNNKGSIDYVVVSKMNDVNDFIDELNNQPYYFSAKPIDVTPISPMTVYSSVNNEIWTFDGTSWI